MRASFRDLSLRRKLVTIIMLTSASALLASSVALFVWDAVQFRADLTRDLTTQADIIAENSAAALSFNDMAAALETLATLRAKPRIDTACLYDAQGRVFARYDRDAERRTVPSRPGRAGYEFTADSLVLFKPILVNDALAGTLYLHSDLAEFFTRVGIQAAATGIVLLASATLAFLLSRRLQRVVSDPILALQETALAVTRQGNYSLRAAPYGRDELGTLVGAFNQMLARVQERDDQLQEANRLKDEFLAIVSHELRSPLNAILGWTRILREGVGPPDTRARALEVIERNARIQTRLVEDLLDVSKIVTGMTRLEQESVNLWSIVETALDVVRPAAQAKSLVFKTACEAESPVTVGDPNRLQQIMWNLLSNAVKFSPHGGTVTVTLRQEHDDTTPAGWYRLAVTDEGRGISREFLPYVFEPFRQADASSTRTHGGLGLGLAIVHRLVELHGGTIAAESEGEGRGATFVIRLPRRVAQVPDETARMSSASTTPLGAVLSGLRVLVVEDQYDAREELEVTLRRYGVHVKSVGTARDGLTAVQQFRPDVLVSDLAMPGEDGIWLIRRVRALRPEEGGATPAVAVTAYADETTRSLAMASGFQFHLAKPYEPAELVRLLGTLTGITH